MNRRNGTGRSNGAGCALVALASLLPGTASGACDALSGPRTAALVELYTSEGCSSCPPAERWLARFARHPDPHIIPVAFHVTYWDGLGWKDRYADPRYTRRQRALAGATGARFVYTPQVVVDGRDFPGWRDAGAFEAAVASARRRAPRAHLALHARALDGGALGGSVDVRVDGAKSPTLALVVVAQQDGLASDVRAGENRGERLAHEAVVRDMASVAVPPAGGVLAWRLRSASGWDLARVSVAAFVQDTRTGEVLQAVSTRGCPIADR